jgi:rsbT co-antagonist protein RsbR
MDEVILLIKRVNLILDISINETVFAFERFSELLLEKAQEEVNELTAPVVPIQDGIAVLPLIGSIDFDRAKLIMEKVVPKIKNLQIECLIMDFSGIVNIDAQIAKYVFDIRNVLRLVGVNTIASGVRPDLAQQAVTEGIDLTSVPTFADVKQAIESLEG